MKTPKHIHDTVRNTLRSIGSKLTTPQTRAVKEILFGLLRNSTSILNHINTEAEIRVGKQSERYRRHLENIDIASLVEKHIFRSLPEVEDDTIIAYDLGDIAKPHAKVMEGAHPIFDGSKRKSSRGYEIHGVSIHNQPVVMELHDADSKFLPQVREEIIKRITKRIGEKGIWVYDRGNDDKKLFTAHASREQRFVIRLKKNRHLIHRKSGMKQAVEDFLPGIYEVRVPGQKWKHTLVVHEHIKESQKQEPIRVLVHRVEVEKAEEIIETYLCRWDIENLYKQMKSKFGLEEIRLLSLKKIKNLLALIQLATSISNKAFSEMAEEKEGESTSIFELSTTFKAFCHKRCLKSNRFAFTSFLKEYSPMLRPREKGANPFQRSLLPRREIRRLERETAEMGVF